jgi:hypothetical protein
VKHGELDALTKLESVRERETLLRKFCETNERVRLTDNSNDSSINMPSELHMLPPYKLYFHKANIDGLPSILGAPVHVMCLVGQCRCKLAQGRGDRTDGCGDIGNVAFAEISASATSGQVAANLALGALGIGVNAPADSQLSRTPPHDAARETSAYCL